MWKQAISKVDMANHLLLFGTKRQQLCLDLVNLMATKRWSFIMMRLHCYEKQQTGQNIAANVGRTKRQSMDEI